MIVGSATIAINGIIETTPVTSIMPINNMAEKSQKIWRRSFLVNNEKSFFIILNMYQDSILNIFIQFDLPHL